MVTCVGCCWNTENNRAWKKSHSIKSCEWLYWGWFLVWADAWLEMIAEGMKGQEVEAKCLIFEILGYTGSWRERTIAERWHGVHIFPRLPRERYLVMHIWVMVERNLKTDDAGERRANWQGFCRVGEFGILGLCVSFSLWKERDISSL